MLTISKALNSDQAQTYHAKEFTSAEQNYWRKGDAVLGEWQGRLAEQYGLSGAIDSRHFARLSEGQNPHSGEQLVRHRTGQEYNTADGNTVRPVEHRAGPQGGGQTPTHGLLHWARSRKRPLLCGDVAQKHACGFS